MSKKLALRRKLVGSVIPAMATPITVDGYHVAVEQVEALVNFLIERDVGGLFVGGSTGEGLFLAASERMKLLEAAIAANVGRVPILAHVGANTTRAAFELAVHAADSGADAIVVIPPTFLGIPDSAALTHFTTIAAAAPELPLLVYDIPHLAVNGISPTLLVALENEIPSFLGVKSSRPDIRPIRQLLDVAGPETILLAGNERIMLGSLALGAHGSISGLSTAIPEPFVSMVNAFFAGHTDEARNWQRICNAVLDHQIANHRIGGIKAILRSRGIDVGNPVPPRPAGPADLWSKMSAVFMPAE